LTPEGKNWARAELCGKAGLDQAGGPLSQKSWRLSIPTMFATGGLDRAVPRCADGGRQPKRFPNQANGPADPLQCRPPPIA
jgi:hypothetical protein